METPTAAKNPSAKSTSTRTFPELAATSPPHEASTSRQAVRNILQGYDAQLSMISDAATKQRSADPGHWHSTHSTSTVGLSVQSNWITAPASSAPTTSNNHSTHSTPLAQLGSIAPSWNVISAPKDLQSYRWFCDNTTLPSSPPTESSRERTSVSIPARQAALMPVAAHGLGQSLRMRPAAGLDSSNVTNSDPTYAYTQQQQRWGSASSSQGIAIDDEVAQMAYISDQYGRPNDSSDSANKLTCSICHVSFTGDYARGNLTRHFKAKHSGDILTCEAPLCGQKFDRSDYRLSHYRKAHPELGAAPKVSRKY